MSPRKQGSAAPQLEETRYTFGDIQRLAGLFGQLLKESSTVKWSIVAAGVGGVLEAVHVLWLFGVWFYWKLF